MSVKEHPVQFVAADKDTDTFVLKKEVLHELLKTVPDNIPIAVVSIVGAFRSGKSFFLNFLLRYLHALQSNQDVKLITKDGIPSWMLYGGDILEGYGGNTQRSNGFSFRSGNERNTEGIWFWNKPFIIPNPVTAGGKMAVLIMDTQGMWDGQTGQGLTACIFGLSTLLSSYQIYNVDRRMQEDHLQHLALFTDYSIRMRNSGKGGDEAPFQHIDYLIRDYANFHNEKNRTECLKEMKAYRDDFLAPRNTDDLNETRNQIKQCYSVIDIFCLPHPGLTVASLHYGGKIREIQATFLNLLNYYISTLFTSSLEPIEINHRLVYKKDFEAYAQRYGDLFSRHEDFPSVNSIMQATAEVEMSRFASDCFDSFYMSMTDALNKSMWLSEEEFAAVQKDATEKTLRVFDSNVTLGDKNRIKKYREALQTRIKDKCLSLEVWNWRRRCEYQKREHDKEIAEVRKELMQVDKKMEELKKESNGYQDLIKQRDKQISRLETDITLEMGKTKSLKQQYEERLKEAGRGKDEDKKKLDSYSQEMVKKERELGELRGKVSALENAKKTLEADASERKAAVKKLQEENTQLRIQVNSKDNEIKTLEADINRKDAAVKKLQEDNTQLRIQVDSKDNEIKTLKADISRLDEKMDSRPNPSVKPSSSSADLVPVNSYPNITISADSGLLSIGPNVETITIASNSCHSIAELEFVDYSRLITIEVGDECLSHVQNLLLTRLPSLTEFKVGKNSFTRKLNGWQEDKSRHFHVVNCKQLQAITVGRYSFSDFSGEFELRDLPELYSLNIGVFDEESWNFSCASFVLRNLPKLKSVILGDKAFGFSTHTVFENLQSLETIKVGDNAMNGTKDDDCSLIMKDLPSLETLISNKPGYTFNGTKLAIITNVPKVKNVELPGSFEQIRSSTVENVGKALSRFLPVDSIAELDATDSSATSISLPNDTCNNPCCPMLDFSRFRQLNSVTIGDDSFENLTEFRLDGLNMLRTLTIGKNSFTKEKKRHGDDPSRSFHVVNCQHLQSIVIGEYSFCDYAGEFELKNLPSLTLLKIGSMEEDSWNFDHASFVIRNLPSLESIELGKLAFFWSANTIIEDLSMLKRITLGNQALQGKYKYDANTLQMKNLPRLTTIQGQSTNLVYYRNVVMQSIPNITSISLESAFEYVEYASVNNVNSRLASLIEISEVVSVITRMPQNANSMNIPSNTRFETAGRFFTIQNHASLQKIVIGDDNLPQVYKFSINGLLNLQSIQIGKNSFTKEKNGKGDNPHRVFSVLGCPQLVSIVIGCYSFSDYSGDFEIRNCGSLQYIKIGEIGTESCNFYEASFILKDLPSLETIELGNKAFNNGEKVDIENMQKLKTIRLGSDALDGAVVNSELIMKNLPLLTTLESQGNSLRLHNNVTLVNIPNVENVSLPDSFTNVSEKTITNVNQNLSSIVSDGNPLIRAILNMLNRWFICSIQK